MSYLRRAKRRALTCAQAAQQTEFGKFRTLSSHGSVPAAPRWRPRETRRTRRLRSRLGATYRSKVYPTTDLSESLAQNAYTLVNAGLIWEKSAKLSFFLQGSNLADKAYKTDGYNIAALGVLNAYYGPPRTFTVGGTYKF